MQPTNIGDLATGVTFTDTFPASGAPTFVSATSSPGSCSTPAGNAVECFIGTLNTNAVATVTITFTATAATAGFTDSGQVTASGSGAESCSRTTPCGRRSRAITRRMYGTPGVAQSNEFTDQSSGCRPCSIAVTRITADHLPYGERK